MKRFPTLLALLLLCVRARADGTEPFRFVHITDTHLSMKSNVEPIKNLVTQINAMTPRPDFVVDTGDVTEAGRPEELDRFLEATSALSIPFYCSPGNHDVRWSPVGKAAFEHAFKRLYGSFDHKGSHFVILDSTVLLEHWGHFDFAQLRWLKDDLKKIDSKMPVFLFFHH